MLRLTVVVLVLVCVVACGGPAHEVASVARVERELIQRHPVWVRGGVAHVHATEAVRDVCRPSLDDAQAFLDAMGAQNDYIVAQYGDTAAVGAVMWQLRESVELACPWRLAEVSGL